MKTNEAFGKKFVPPMNRERGYALPSVGSGIRRSTSHEADPNSYLTRKPQAKLQRLGVVDLFVLRFGPQQIVLTRF